MDWRVGNRILHSGGAAGVRYGQYAFAGCRVSGADTDEAPSEGGGSQSVDIAHLCLSDFVGYRFARIGRDGLLRCDMPFHGSRFDGWILDPTGQHCSFPLACDRVCHHLADVLGRNQLLLIIYVHVQTSPEGAFQGWRVPYLSEDYRRVYANPVGGLFFTTPMDVEEAFRSSVFQVVTILTTTGFCTFDYMTWTPLLWLMVSFLMYLGACTGSTTGGIKCVRIHLLGRIINNEFKKIMRPNLVAPVKLGGKSITERVMTSIVAFILIYLGMVAIGLTVNMAFGLDFVEAYGLSLTCVGNVGPGLGFYGPANSMSSLPDVLKWFNSFLMLIGRLEFFAVFVLLTPVFWKKR